MSIYKKYGFRNVYILNTVEISYNYYSFLLNLSLMFLFYIFNIPIIKITLQLLNFFRYLRDFHQFFDFR